MTRLLVIAALVLSSTPALADDLYSREHQSGVVTRVRKGVFQLGVDSVFVLGMQSEGEISSSRLNATGTLGLRYFAKDNLGASVRGGYLYRDHGDTTDSGFFGTAWVNYFLRFGEGIFLTPGVGAGVIVASREVPAGTAQVMESRLLGGVAAFEMPLAVFLNRRFSLSAGPELLLSFGGTAPETGEGQSFVALDGGFKVGAAYAF